jgi:hypothetical protein
MKSKLSDTVYEALSWANDDQQGLDDKQTKEMNALIDLLEEYKIKNVAQLRGALEELEYRNYKI